MSTRFRKYWSTRSYLQTVKRDICLLYRLLYPSQGGAGPEHVAGSGCRGQRGRPRLATLLRELREHPQQGCNCPRPVRLHVQDVSRPHGTTRLRLAHVPPFTCFFVWCFSPRSGLRALCCRFRVAQVSPFLCFCFSPRVFFRGVEVCAHGSDLRNEFTRTVVWCGDRCWLIPPPTPFRNKNMRA